MQYSIRHFNLRGHTVITISLDATVLTVSHLASIEHSPIVINDIDFCIFQTSVINYETN